MMPLDDGGQLARVNAGLGLHRMEGDAVSLISVQTIPRSLHFLMSLTLEQSVDSVDNGVKTCDLIHKCDIVFGPFLTSQNRKQDIAGKCNK